RETYERLAHESGDNDALLEQSLMGAAKANETLGDVGKAKQFYQQLAQHSKSVLAREAEARAKALDDENTKKEIETLAGEFAPSSTATRSGSRRPRRRTPSRSRKTSRWTCCSRTSSWPSSTSRPTWWSTRPRATGAARWSTPCASTSASSATSTATTGPASSTG